MSGKRPYQAKVQDDDCCIVMDSSDEEFESWEAGPSKRKEGFDCILIDSNSDDEPFAKRKRVKFCKTSSKDKILVSSDSDEPPVIISDDDDSDVEGPVIIQDGSCDEGQTTSIETEIELTISKFNASDDTDEQDVGEKPASDPEVKLPISDTNMVTDEEVVAKQPKKKKKKVKNTCVTPAITGRKGRKSSTKNRTATKFSKYRKYKNGIYKRSGLH